MSLTALNRWLVAQALLWFLLLVLAGGGIVAQRMSPWVLGPGAALMLVSYGGLWVILGSGRRLADMVTLLRFVGLLVVLGLVAAGHALDWTLWILMVLVVVGDLADGWCARRFGGSEGGAILDMETDQFTTLGLGVLAAGFAGAGIWTLLLPGCKYAYVLGLRAIGVAAHDPKPRAGDNRRGRVICAAVMILLLASLCPAVPGFLARSCTIAAVLALAYSFSSDAAFLWRHRRNALRTE